MSHAKTERVSGEWIKHMPLVIRVLLGIGVLAAGVGIALVLKWTEAKPPLREQVVDSLTVATVKVARMDVARVWTGYGSARSMQAVDIASQVGARVVTRPENIEAGLAVEKGDLIVQLDKTDFVAKLEAAEQLVAQTRADLAGLKTDEASLTHQLELAKDQVNIEQQELVRSTSALESGASNVSEVERVTKSLQTIERVAASIEQQLSRLPSRRRSLEAQIARFQADAVRAREDLARTRITSPISGVLQSIQVEAGDLVSAGAKVARVVDISRVEIPLKRPASALISLRVGDTVALHPDGPIEHVWTGRIARISPEADSSTRSLTAFVEVHQAARAPGESTAYKSTGSSTENVQGVQGEHTDLLLLPGQFVLGMVTGEPAQGVLLVPRRAVVKGAVYLAQPADGGQLVARKKQVQVLFHVAGAYPDIDPLESQWSVLGADSLTPGAQLIVTNLDSLHDGRFIAAQARIAGTKKTDDATGSSDGALPEGSS